MGDRTRGYAHRVDIQAPCERVWAALIDPALLEQWCARRARVDARAGGSHVVQIDQNIERVAHIDVFMPPRRLRLIYMPQSHWPSDEGVIVDDFMLVPENDATLLRLLGSGIPDHRSWDVASMSMRNDWGRALLRLKLTVEKALAMECQRTQSAG
jgi:uncharacterized protein YndB with AHSA1/START domain